jgi:hypothetical protein
LCLRLLVGVINGMCVRQGRTRRVADLCVEQKCVLHAYSVVGCVCDVKCGHAVARNHRHIHRPCIREQAHHFNDANMNIECGTPCRRRLCNVSGFMKCDATATPTTCTRGPRVQYFTDVDNSAADTSASGTQTTRCHATLRMFARILALAAEQTC